MHTSSCCCGDEQTKNDVNKKRYKNDDHRMHCLDSA